jgi:predicted 3-demethylubiquinone-9 3-methyltransferase (glyoxalase superfamily)
MATAGKPENSFYAAVGRDGLAASLGYAQGIRRWRVAKKERTSNAQKYDLPLVRQGRRGCRALLCRDLSGQRSRRRASRPGRLSGGGKKGDVLTMEFTVAGLPCLGINGGSAFKHIEAFSFQAATDDQEETDRYWNAIVGNGGQESACDWCKDKWGVSWQITPRALTQALAAGGGEARRAFDAMMGMTKIDVAAIEAARRG